MNLECPRCGGTMYDDEDGSLICQDCFHTKEAHMPDDLTAPGKAEESAENARIVLENYQQLVGGGDPDDVEASVTDLITDLLHLAAAEDVNITHLLAMSEMHFRAER